MFSYGRPQAPSRTQHFQQVRQHYSNCQVHAPDKLMLIPLDRGFSLQISLPDNFPTGPPALFVTPAAEHPLLDAAGRQIINTQALSQWRNTDGYLLTVVQEAINLLRNPPLSPKGAAAQPAPPSYAAAWDSSTQPRPNQQAQQPVPSSNSGQLYQPTIPQSFPELDNMSLAQLEDLDRNDRSFDAFFQKQLVDVQRSKDVRKSNQEMAAQTLGRQPEVQELTSSVQALFQEALKLNNQYEGLLEQQQQVLHNYSEEKALKDLRDTMEVAKKKGLAARRKFLDGDMEDKDFVKEFMKQRKAVNRAQIQQKALKGGP